VRLGAHLLTTIGPDPAPAYLKALRQAGRDPADFRIGQLRLLYVAPSDEEAWADIAAPLHQSMQYYIGAMRDAGDLPGEENVWPFASAEALRSSGFARAALVGTPDTVAERLTRMLGRIHCTQIICNTQVAGLEPEKGTRSIELFARQVMPAFSGLRTDPEPPSGTPG
jgi:alkanesulfonate monooxygenase SsuD/methylene tetrahydromethanopterin reductase-like flavin-dependent oxidoreductase (luciferase family)